jgi:hypothetical protein
MAASKLPGQPGTHGPQGWDFPNPFTVLRKTRKGLTRNRPGGHQAPISRHEPTKVGLPLTARFNHPPMPGIGRPRPSYPAVESNEGESVRR